MLLIIGYDSRTKTLLPTIYDSLFLIFCHIVLRSKPQALQENRCTGLCGAVERRRGVSDAVVAAIRPQMAVFDA